MDDDGTTNPLPSVRDVLDTSPQRQVQPARYCLRCQEPLPPFENGPSCCAKCKLQYHGSDASTFRTDQTYLRWKFWFPGLCAAIASGVMSYAICLQTGDLGTALFVAVPVSFGAILGYATRAHWVVTVLLSMVAIAGVVTALVAMSFAGFFCGMTLGLIFVVPTLVGVAVGWILRVVLKSTAWDQRSFLPTILLASLPYLAQSVECRLPRRTEVASVRTELTVWASPLQAWNAIMFYEEVDHDPPWLLRLALPKPIRSVGDKQQVGQIVRCYYDRGHLLKRISRREPGRLLAFEVLEQKLHFERDITLLDGSFSVRPIDRDTAHLVLTTRYRRHLSPRWLWQPIERQVVHSLHGHVLEGMRRHAEHHAEPATNEGRHAPGDESHDYPRHSDPTKDNPPLADTARSVRVVGANGKETLNDG